MCNHLELKRDMHIGYHLVGHHEVTPIWDKHESTKANLAWVIHTREENM